MLGHKRMTVLGTQTEVKVVGLENKAEAVFNVLNSHKVFGSIEGTHLEVERRGFKNMVIDHATSDDNRTYLELTYPSCVRLIIHTNIFAGEADFREVTAYDHPRKNESMNYDELNEAIKEALAQ